MENREGIDRKKRLNTAKRLKATYEENIRFIKERIAIQEKVDFNPVSYTTGARVKQYSELDIQVQQEKLDKANEVINDLK